MTKQDKFSKGQNSEALKNADIIGSILTKINKLFPD